MVSHSIQQGKKASLRDEGAGPGRPRPRGPLLCTTAYRGPCCHGMLSKGVQSRGFMVGNKSAIWHNSTYPFTAIIAQLQSRPSVFGTLHNSAYLVVSLS